MKKKLINDSILNVLNFLKENQNPTKEEIEKKQEFLNEKVEPLLKKQENLKNFENYINNIKEKLNEHSNDLNEKDKKIIENSIKDTLQFLKDNKENLTKEKINEKRKEFENLVEPILSKLENEKILFNHANKIKKRIEDPEDILSKNLTLKEKKFILSKTEDLLNLNPKNTSLEKINEKRKDFDKTVLPLINKIDQKDAYIKYIQSIKDNLKPIYLTTQEKKKILKETLKKN